MLKWFFGWGLIAACLFAAVNWFLVPSFHAVRNIMPHGVSILAALGIAGIVVIAGVLFGSSK